MKNSDNKRQMISYIIKVHMKIKHGNMLLAEERGLIMVGAIEKVLPRYSEH